MKAFRMLAGGSLFVAIAILVWSVPGTFQIQGKLTGTGGRPLSGARDWRMQFYTAAEGGSALGGVLTGTVAIEPTGRFVIEVAPPTAVLAAAGDVYYELAVDSATPPNGVGPSDVFPERVKISSVLWARKAVEADTLDGLHASVLTLDGVAARGAATGRELTLGGGVQLPALSVPPATVNRLLHTSGSLYWNGLPLMERTASAYVIVKTTGSATGNALNLIAAYAQARALTPNGLTKSATNRAAVLVPPGRYDLGTLALTMDTEYVDLVGLSSARADQFITGASNGIGTGVLRQTANNVRIENLTVECSYGGARTYSSEAPAAYFLDRSTSSQTVIRNCEFIGTNNGWSMRLTKNFGGLYVDCKGGNLSFAAWGTAYGTFINCVGGDDSFASQGWASGTFINCTGGDYSFAPFFAAEGTFIDCTGGVESFGGWMGTASGTFIRCTGGDRAFAGNRSELSGTFIDCAGGQNAFGGNNEGVTTCTVNANLRNCRMTGSRWDGTFAGKMENCYWGWGMTLAATARIYNTTFLGTLNLNNTAAGVTQSRARSITGQGSNVFGATNAAAFNISSTGVQ